MRFLPWVLIFFVVACGGVTAKQDAGPDDADDGDASDAPACAAVEDCFNGLDDDCNGHTDCDDAACTGGATPIAECVPDPGGALAGTLETGACPSEYPNATGIFSDLTAGSCAAGTCSCGTTPIGGARCDSTLARHSGGSSLACATIGAVVFATNGGNGCISFSALGSGYHTLDTTLVAQCAAPGGGTSAKVDPSWGSTGNFCTGNSSGGGCGTGQVCMPKAPRYCVLETGEQAECTRPGYSVQDPTSYFTGYDDSARTCSCACNVTGTCGPVLFGTGSCTTGVTDGCMTGFTGYTNAQAPTPSGVGCAAGGASNGATSTAGFERTLCCTN
ncbi:MAG TPA: hypothetical protein VM513_04665 [Kofleriaceae bacterium]|jgi:hypothetical protein|nr:hypothetical protein [Kofleriaceae bacterium]